MNTGAEAVAARGLRGRYDHDQFERGNLLWKEHTLYRGSHSVQCFIVKDGVCVAKSELFVVNIE